MAVALSVALSQIATPLAHAAEVAAPAGAVASHLVNPDQVTARLAERAAERQAQVQQVQGVLDTAEAQKQARVMGIDINKMRGAVPHLSDGELKDLSQRAGQVKDLAAGHHGDDGLIILGVILLLAGLAVLIAVSDYGNNYYDDCGCY
jgi:hypothetical protein